MREGRMQSITIKAVSVALLVLSGCPQADNKCAPNYNGRTPTVTHCKGCKSASGCRTCCSYIPTGCPDNTCDQAKELKGGGLIREAALSAMVPDQVYAAMGQKLERAFAEALSVLNHNERFDFAAVLSRVEGRQWEIVVERLGAIKILIDKTPGYVPTGDQAYAWVQRLTYDPNFLQRFLAGDISVMWDDSNY